MRDEFGRPIEICPLCESTDARWRGRRPWDFAFTWMRWSFELIASGFAGNRRGDAGYYGSPERAEVLSEIREANTGHKTPKRFWKCRACRRKGHEF